MLCNVGNFLGTQYTSAFHQFDIEYAKGLWLCTEFQRGILTQDAAGAWSVRVTGEQGSGILRSMTEANCFIILPTDQGNVAAGTLVEVQIMEGVV